MRRCTRPGDAAGARRRRRPRGGWKTRLSMPVILPLMRDTCAARVAALPLRDDIGAVAVDQRQCASAMRRAELLAAPGRQPCFAVGDERRQPRSASAGFSACRSKARRRCRERWPDDCRRQCRAGAGRLSLRARAPAGVRGAAGRRRHRRSSAVETYDTHDRRTPDGNCPALDRRSRSTAACFIPPRRRQLLAGSGSAAIGTICSRARRLSACRRVSRRTCGVGESEILVAAEPTERGAVCSFLAAG